MSFGSRLEPPSLLLDVEYEHNRMAGREDFKIFAKEIIFNFSSSFEREFVYEKKGWQLSVDKNPATKIDLNYFIFELTDAINLTIKHKILKMSNPLKIAKLKSASLMKF
jgi:hypothetical protein